MGDYKTIEKNPKVKAYQVDRHNEEELLEIFHEYKKITQCDMHLMLYASESDIYASKPNKKISAHLVGGGSRIADEGQFIVFTYPDEYSDEKPSIQAMDANEFRQQYEPTGEVKKESKQYNPFLYEDKTETEASENYFTKFFDYINKPNKSAEAEAHITQDKIEKLTTDDGKKISWFIIDSNEGGWDSAIYNCFGSKIRIDVLTGCIQFDVNRIRCANDKGSFDIIMFSPFVVIKFLDDKDDKIHICSATRFYNTILKPAQVKGKQSW